MTRTPVAIIAGLLMAIAGGLYAFAPAHDAAVAVCFRAGLIMGALWLALADPPRPIKIWRVVGLVASGYLFLRAPRPTKIALLVAGPVLLLLFKSRAPRTPRT